MALEKIYLGTTPDDDTGDDLRTAGGKINTAISNIDLLNDSVDSVSTDIAVLERENTQAAPIVEGVTYTGLVANTGQYLGGTQDLGDKYDSLNRMIVLTSGAVSELNVATGTAITWTSMPNGAGAVFIDPENPAIKYCATAEAANPTFLIIYSSGGPTEAWVELARMDTGFSFDPIKITPNVVNGVAYISARGGYITIHKYDITTNTITPNFTNEASPGTVTDFYMHVFVENNGVFTRFTRDGWVSKINVSDGIVTSTFQIAGLSRNYLSGGGYRNGKIYIGGDEGQCYSINEVDGTGLVQIHQTTGNVTRAKFSMLIGNEWQYGNYLSNQLTGFNVDIEYGKFYKTKNAGPLVVDNAGDSISLGVGCVIGKDGAIHIGSYSDDTNTPWFAIGAGTADIDRKNLIEFQENGTIIAPFLSLANIVDVKSLITLEYINAMNTVSSTTTATETRISQMVRISQVDYDALGAGRPADKLYIIDNT